MVTEARLEEAISVGMVRDLHARYAKDQPRVASVVKYSSEESAPSAHGLYVEFESGEKFEITIKRLKA
jgi:hypothetical protein